MVRRALVVFFASLALLLVSFAVSSESAEARRCPRGYYKRCGSKRCSRGRSVCVRRYRGRCVKRRYKRRCYRKCRCVRSRRRG
jgi:hypothetical protein